MIARELERLGIRPRGLHDGENRAACPRCDRGASDDALAVRLDRDRAFWICHRCGWTGAVSAAGDVREASAPVRLPKPSDRRERYELAAQLWHEAVPLTGTPGDAYLKRRACLIPPSCRDLRFHPRLYCRDAQRHLPAIVARVSTVIGNRAVGIHRLFLDPRGDDKAIAKKRLGGADEPVCVRLYPDDEVTYSLAIAEGIETALAAAHLHAPIWATLDAGGMARFPVIPGIETLEVFADHDQVGIEAAAKCVDRWKAARRRAVGIAPTRLGADMNDVVREAIHG
jgi:hypothetical protein